MKKSALLLITFLLLNILMPVGMADIYEPIIVIDYNEEINVFNAGEKGILSVPIVNNSPNLANNIEVRIAGDHPFRGDVNALKVQINNLNPYRKTDVKFNVEINPLAKGKVYEFDVVFSYTNYSGTQYSETQKMYVKINSTNKEPVIGVFMAETMSDSIKPGVEDAIRLKVMNSGTVDAKDVVVKIAGFGIENLMLNRDVDTKKISTINAGENEFMYFNVTCAPKAKSGIYPYALKISYIDEFGGTYEKNLEVYIHVEGNDTSSANISIENIKVPEKIAPNQAFEITCDVVNDGSILLDTAEVSIEYPSDFISVANSKKVFKKMKPGESQPMTFKIMAKSGTNSDSYSGYITVKYVADGDTADKAQTIQEYVGLIVDGTSGSSKPKLIIENYEYGGEHVLAGEPYTLKLFIKNTSTSNDTRNIKVTLTSEDNVFTPIDSSSSFFINEIKAGEVYEHNIELKTKIDSSVKIYSLTVKMQYEDGKGNAYDAQENPYEESEALSIAVAQPVRLETAELIVPFETYVGQPFYIEQEFYNMGKATMYNMMVKLEGPQSNEGSYFVGNFEAGRSEYYSAQAFPMEEGAFEGKLVYTFEDALGNVSTQEEPFSYNVMAAPDYGQEGDMNGGMYEEFPMEEPTNSSPIAKIISGIVVVIVIIAAIIFMKKRKKRKLEMELEALDE